LELGLALLTLAAVLALPLPPSERSKVFEPADFVTIALAFPGVGLLCAVLALGRIDWWLDRPWIGLALIGAIVLLGAAVMVERRRANPLLITRFLGQKVILRILAVALCVRIITAEQTYGSIGLLSSLGLGIDQFRRLYAVITLAAVTGLFTALFTFRPKAPARGIQLACLLIAIAAFLDSGATSLTRPADLYLSQAMVGFAALLFIGPAMVIGLSRALVAGPQYFITWVVAFLATQNLGSLVGPALFGTLQTVREKFHSNVIGADIRLTNPVDAAQLAGGAQRVGGVITDPSLRAAESAALLGQRVTREANVLAFNDVFLVISVLALLLFLWGVAIELKMRRRGEISPIVQFVQTIAAKLAEARSEEGRS
jgi:hypothetical protein